MKESLEHHGQRQHYWEMHMRSEQKQMQKVKAEAYFKSLMEIFITSIITVVR